MIRLENLNFEVPKRMESQEVDPYKRRMNLAWKALKNKAKKGELGMYRIEFGTEENHQTHLILIPDRMIPEKMKFGRGTLENPIYFSKDLAGYLINNLLKKKADVTRYGNVVREIINTNGETVDIQKLREIHYSVSRFTSEKTLVNKGIALFEEFKELKSEERMNYFVLRSLYRNNYATVRGFHY